MSKIIFITGGAASGKTRWAASYFDGFDDVLYLCVADEMDKEILDRINYSNNIHGVDWNIHTGVTKPVELMHEHKFSIFDNLGAYVSRSMSELCSDVGEMTYEQQRQIEKTIIDEMLDLIDRVKEIEGTLLILSLETGFSVCPEKQEQVMFREILGNVNQRIANMCTDVYMSASGIQFKIK